MLTITILSIELSTAVTKFPGLKKKERNSTAVNQFNSLQISVQEEKIN